MEGNGVDHDDTNPLRPIVTLAWNWVYSNTSITNLMTKSLIKIWISSQVYISINTSLLKNFKLPLLVESRKWGLNFMCRVTSGLIPVVVPSGSFLITLKKRQIRLILIKRSDIYMPTNIDHSVRRNICTSKTAVCRNIPQTGVDWKSLEDSLVCAEMVERFRSSLLSSLVFLSNLCCCFSVLSLLFHCHTRLAPAKVFCEHQDCVIYAEIVSSTMCSFLLLILQLDRHANGCCSFLAYAMQTSENYENWQIQ